MALNDRKRYLRVCVAAGATLFLSACAVLIFYDAFYMGGTLQNFFAKLFSILAPVLYGFAMAYLLSPVVNFIERLLKRCDKGGGAARRKLRMSDGLLRAVSILLTWAFVLLLIYLLMVMLIPQLVESVKMLIANAENYYNQIYEWVDGFLKQDSEASVGAKETFDRYYDSAVTALKEQVLPWAQSLLANLTGGIWSGIWSVVSFFYNLIIGVIVSVYMLAMKEKSAARCCKMLYGIFKEESAAWIIRATRKVDAVFSGFVRGKLLDSLIIGVLCLIGCSILGVPYTPLVSVIVGVTNVIPFFGPFLGAIPSAFLILLVSPLKCLYFVIFIILLQQLDGNVIGPKIIGGATGISSFWVVVAILIGGGFGSVLGMFLGVPVCACLQMLVKHIIDGRLRKRNMPVEAYEYVRRRGEREPLPDSKEN